MQNRMAFIRPGPGVFGNVQFEFVCMWIEQNGKMEGDASCFGSCLKIARTWPALD